MLNKNNNTLGIINNNNNGMGNNNYIIEITCLTVILYFINRPRFYELTFFARFGPTLGVYLNRS